MRPLGDGPSGLRGRWARGISTASIGSVRLVSTGPNRVASVGRASLPRLLTGLPGRTGQPPYTTTRTPLDSHGHKSYYSHMLHVSVVIGMKLDIRRLADGNAVLSGKTSGFRMFLKLVEATKDESKEPQLLLLDFSGIDVATGSYLRETVLHLRDHVRGRRSNFYPVVANANEAVLEELSDLLRSGGGALMTCALGHGDQVTRSSVIGDLEPKQRMTFELIAKSGETDAAGLKRAEDDGVQVTAWNNRLAALAGLGLIMEITEGRSKRYRPLFEVA
jgi:hypothetical protein